MNKLTVSAVLIVASLALMGVAHASRSAKIEFMKWPSSLDPGEEGEVRITVTNTGTEQWTQDTSLVVEAVKDPNGNKPTQTSFAARKRIGGIGANGDATTETLDVEAGFGRGKWTLEAWVEIGSSRIPGSDTTQIEVTSGYKGRFVNWKVPRTLQPNKDYTFELTVENTGEVWWDPGEVVLDSRLKKTVTGSDSDGKSAFQKRHKIENDDVIYPDDDYTFKMKLRMPKTAGKWEVEWQMYDQEERELFGQKMVMVITVQ